MGPGGSEGMTAIAHELVEAAVDRLPVDALTPARKAALAQFVTSGFPSIKDEDWKYTNLAAAVELSNACLSDESGSESRASWTTDAKQAIDDVVEGIDANWIIIANGVTALETISNAAALESQGIYIAKLSSGSAGSAIISDDPLTSFNAALLQDGLQVRIRASAYESKPLGFLFFDNVENGGLSQARIIVDVEPEANIEIVEAHVSIGTDPQFANTVVQLNIEERGRVDYVRIQDRAIDHMQVGKLIVELHSDAVFDYASFDFGGALVRNDIAVDIVQAGATASLHGLYLAGAKQHIDNHTRVDHRVGPAVSREEYRGILSGRARCVFNGKAIVHDGADGTDAEQSNHNLLLSETAEIDTKPELEIYADDVKCAHGATVGQLDKSALFYLRTRGLDEDEAAQLLTRAFAARILTSSPVESTHAYISTKTDQRLDALINGDSP
jgi:Fe-S cluster assembly protein SufD